MKKYSVVAGLLFAVLITYSTVNILSTKNTDSKSDSNKTTSLKRKTSIVSDVNNRKGTWGVDIEGKINKLPPEEKKIALEAVKKRQTMNIFTDRDGKVILVSVGDVKYHGDPSDDKQYVGGYTDKPDPNIIGKGLLDK